MKKSKSKDPLEGMTLEKILNVLVDYYGWDELGNEIRINCFNTDPSIKSSLTFLRRTPWARTKVEEFYVAHLDEVARSSEESAAAATDPAAKPSED